MSTEPSRSAIVQYNGRIAGYLSDRLLLLVRHSLLGWTRGVTIGG